MSKRFDLYLGLLLVLLTALVYWPVTHHEFLNYDDHLYVTDNPVVQDGLTLEGVRWGFVSCHASNWHPITWLSHMADGSIFFLEPGGHHLTNLVFHLLNTVLLFGFLRRISGARWRLRADPRAFRLAPAARGIGGLGGGTKRSAEHILFDSDPLGLRYLCAKAGRSPLSRGARAVCSGTDVQANGGNRALPPAAARLLAAGSHPYRSPPDAPRPRRRSHPRGE